MLPNSRSRDIASTSPWTKEPTIKELTGLFLLSGSIFVLFICLFQSYPSKVDNFGDNLSYMEVASAIRHWSFKGLVIEHFWGLPYLMASVSIATRMSDRAALLVICVLSSFASVLLARRMWGGWVAGLFAVLNLDWIQRSLLGGSEPLFTALIFGSFLAVRRGRWMLATVLASLATICRPLGFIGLLAIAVSLLWKREPLKCLLATAMGLAIGVLYALPLALYFGSPLANIHGYDPDGSLFGIPFHAVIVGTMRYPAPLSNLILTCGWIVFVLGGTAAMATNQDYRAFARQFSVEATFAALYLISVFCYNRPYWARGSFPRFVIPALPFVLLALLRWIPKDRRILWILAVVSPIFAAASALGIHIVVATLRRLLG